MSNRSVVQSMRIRALLYSNSMPLTLHLCLLVASAILLFLCSITSSLAGRYQDFHLGTFPCGDFNFGYPFGKNGNGCGDPEFQLLNCDDPEFAFEYPFGKNGNGCGDPTVICEKSNHPLLNISGNEYRILGYMDLEINDYQKHMTIVNNNLFGDKCNLSRNYSQFWSSGSHFHVSDGYTNLTLWKHCAQIFVPSERKFNACGDQWFYNFNLPIIYVEELKMPSCNVFQLPVESPLDDLDGIYINTLRESGFEVTWSVDPNRARICEACFKSNRTCGYDISSPTKFQCICPDNTWTSEKCSSNGGFTHRPL